MNLLRAHRQALIYLGSVVTAWLLLGYYYILRVPPAFRSYDGLLHAEYTHIIATQHRLPLPYEVFQAYHPPLYYLIDTLLDPLGDSHLKLVRLASLLYGAVFLIVMWLFLRPLKIAAGYRGLILLFIAASPLFIVIFTSYNNDALSSMWCAAILLLSTQLFAAWSWRKAGLLLVVTILAFYTKLTLPFLLTPLSLYFIAQAVRAPLLRPKAVRLIGIYGLAAIALLPWAYFHNYRTVGTLFPNNFKSAVHSSDQYKEAARFAFQVPGFKTGEWSRPYVWSRDRNCYCENKGYASTWFVSSVLSSFPYPAEYDPLSWALLLIQLSIIFCAVKAVLSNAFSRLNGWLIGCVFILQGAFSIYAPFVSSADFRYASWGWLAQAGLIGWTIMARSKPENRRWAGLYLPLLLIVSTGLKLWFYAKMIDLR